MAQNKDLETLYSAKASIVGSKDVATADKGRGKLTGIGGSHPILSEAGILLEPKLSDSFLNLSYPVGAALCGRPIREPTEGLPYDIFSP